MAKRQFSTEVTVVFEPDEGAVREPMAARLSGSGIVSHDPGPSTTSSMNRRVAPAMSPGRGQILDDGQLRLDVGIEEAVIPRTDDPDT